MIKVILLGFHERLPLAKQRIEQKLLDRVERVFVRGPNTRDRRYFVDPVRREQHVDLHSFALGTIDRVGRGHRYVPGENILLSRRDLKSKTSHIES